MALKALLKSLDGLGEDIKRLYVQRDGMYFLDVEAVDGYSLEDVSKLRTALEKEKDTARNRQVKLDRFGELDPEQVKTDLEALAQLRKIDPKKLAEEQVKSHLDQLSVKHKIEVDKKDAEIRETRGQLEEKLKTAEAIKYLGAKKANTDLLLPHVERQIQVVRGSDGKYAAEVIGRDGKRLLSKKSGSTDYMSIEELIEVMEKDPVYAPGFPGSGAAGSGATTAANGAGGNGKFTISEADASNPHKYRAAKAAADKAGEPLQIIGIQ